MAAFSAQGRTCYHKPFTLKCKTCKKGKKEVIKVGCWDWTTDHQSEAVQNRRLNQLSYPGREVGAKNWHILELQPYIYMYTFTLWQLYLPLCNRIMRVTLPVTVSDLLMENSPESESGVMSCLLLYPFSINKPLLWGIGIAISCKNLCHL